MQLRGLVCRVKAVVSLIPMSKVAPTAAMMLVVATTAAVPWHEVQAAAPHAITAISSAAFIAAPRRKKTPGRKRVPRGDATSAQQTSVSPEAPGSPPPPANLPGPPPLPDRYTAMALLPIEAIDASRDVVAQVETALLAEIDELADTRAVTPFDVLNDLRPLDLDPSRCNGDVTCLARAGRYARAQRAMAVQLASLGGTLSIAVQLIDTVTGMEISRVGETISEDANERAGELHRLAVQLLAPQTYVGTLIVSCPHEGTDVYVDDQLVGTTPLSAPLTALRAGPHILHLTKSGFADLYRFVDVVYNRTSTVQVDLENNTVSGVIVEVESATGFGALLVRADVDGVDVRVDGEPVGTTPMAGPIEKVAAGKRRLSLRQAGKSATIEEIEVPTGARLDLAVRSGPDGLAITARRVVPPDAPLSTLESLEAGELLTQTSAAKRPWSWRAKSGVVSAGLGILALGAAGYYGSQVRDIGTKSDRIIAYWNDAGPPASQADLTRMTDDSSRLDRLNRRGLAAQSRQWAALGTGATLIAMGTGLFVWDLRRGASLWPTAALMTDGRTWRLALDMSF